jgi:hypothetical protein
MFPRGGYNAGTSRRRLRGTTTTPDAIARRRHTDPGKALVMKFIAELVVDGFAEWELLGSGEIKLRFDTGEIFILGEKAIVVSSSSNQGGKKVAVGSGNNNSI